MNTNLFFNVVAEALTSGSFVKRVTIRDVEEGRTVYKERATKEWNNIEISINKGTDMIEINNRAELGLCVIPKEHITMVNIKKCDDLTLVNMVTDIKDFMFVVIN